MRVILVLGMSLIFSNTALAQPARLPPEPFQPQSALANGRPAGLKPAQGHDNTLAIVLGAGALVGAIALVGANSGNNPAAAPTSTVNAAP